MDDSRVRDLKDATKNQKHRPEFPSHLGRYSFIKSSLVGSKTVEVLMLNELRCEYIDKEVLDAIKRGQEIDLS
jgi:hypothetical protein